MNKKTSLTLSLTIIALLICSCQRRTSESTSSIISSGSSSTTLSSSSQPTSSSSIFSTTSTTATSSSSSTTSSSSSSKTSSSSSTSSTDPAPSGYYAKITNDMSGDVLRNKLNEVNNDHITKYIGYDGLKTFLPKCDINPDDNTKMVGFYDNASLPRYWDSQATWNREHVWPNARGGNLVEKDAFMARPCSTAINSSRGSKGYGYDSYDPFTDKKITNKVAYYRGVCARIIFYCMIANSNLILTDDVFDRDYGQGYSPKNTMGTISDLLEWNLMYLPSVTSYDYQNDLARRVELNRNEVIYSDADGQGNRNPFVDHPEYACRIWGTYNSKTRNICGM